MLQIVRRLTDAGVGVLEGPRFLICDRDRKSSTAVRQLLETCGVAGDPDAVSRAELQCARGAVCPLNQRECLNRVIPLRERHFRQTLAEFVVHYHRERNHQGLGNELIEGVGRQRPAAAFGGASASVAFLSYYYRAA